MVPTLARPACLLALAALMASPPLADAQDMSDPRSVQMVRYGCEASVTQEVGSHLSQGQISSYCDCYSRTITSIMSTGEMQEAMRSGMEGVIQHPKVQQAAGACAAQAFR